MTLGEKVRKYRMAKGLTTTELGEMTGLSQQSISAYENGISRPLEVSKRALASALNIKPSDLDDDKEENK